jgi:NAD-dependent dihydropyrimidine dehydrogenase PreA subunit
MVFHVLLFRGLPTVDEGACIACELCYVTCGRNVYELHEPHAVAIDPMNCAVGCSTCANICPTNAIAFPPLDAVWKLERERQNFRTVRKEAHRKHERNEAIKAREAAQAAQEHISRRAKVEVAGEFGEKRFLIRLEELIENRAYEVVNLKLEAPTVKGAKQEGSVLPDLRSYLGAAGRHWSIPHRCEKARA